MVPVAPASGPEESSVELPGIRCWCTANCAVTPATGGAVAASCSATASGFEGGTLPWPAVNAIAVTLTAPSITSARPAQPSTRTDDRLPIRICATSQCDTHSVALEHERSFT
jgi:hypothetical protein